MLIGTEAVSGVEVEVHCDRYGMFSIRPVREEGRGESLGRADKLYNAKAQARTALAKRRVKVAVAFVTIEGAKGVATGRHMKNRDVLATVNGSRERLSGHGLTFKADIPQDVLDRYLKLQDELADAKREALKIERDWKLDLGRAVDRAMDEAAAEAADA